jgi:hypothetical protein
MLQRVSKNKCSLPLFHHDFLKRISAGEHVDVALRVGLGRLSSTEQSIFNDIYRKFDAKRKEIQEEWQAKDQEYYYTVRQKLLESEQCAEYMNGTLPLNLFQRTFEHGYPLFYLAVAVQMFGREKVTKLSVF